MTRAVTTYRVLVVDDHDGDVKMLEEAVIASGLSLLITRARNPFAALDMLATDNAFDLILSDLNMPRMSGMELCEHLKTMPEASAIPRLLMSSSAREGLPVTFSASKSTPYVKKPDGWEGFVAFVKGLHALLGGMTSSDSTTRHRVQPIEREGPSPA